MSNFETVKIESNTSFKIKMSGNYVVVITAKASAWWQNIPQFLRRFFQDDNLSIALDNNPLELKWNGNDLKGLEQTGIFFTRLRVGEHTLQFKESQNPSVGETRVYRVLSVDPNLLEILPLEIKEGDRRPVIKLAVIDAVTEKIKIEARVSTGIDHSFFQRDDDDFKIVINGKIILNDLPKSHPNWYWCGRAQALTNSSTRTLEKDLPSKNSILIEFFADRSPVISELRLFLQNNTKPEFNKFLIIDDLEFLNLKMNQEQIDVFLRQKAGENSNHIAFKSFDSKSVSEIIFKACTQESINPKVILTKLQAEQGLVSGSTSIKPTKEQLDNALGVGVFDEGTDLEYQGFTNQIFSATRTLRNNYYEAQKNGLKVEIDGVNVTVKNNATYSLYRYTPHVSGAELFFNIYHDFFDDV